MHFNWFRFTLGQSRVLSLLISWVFFSVSITTTADTTLIRTAGGRASSCDFVLGQLPVVWGQRNGVSVMVEPKIRAVQRLSLIIPTYHEWDNGNVQRIIRTIQKQNLPHQLIEAVFVVNNSPEIAKNPSHPILRENLKTIAYLQRLKPNFRIRVVDLATVGIETNMGILRQKGSEVALRESGVDPDDHILIHMDADTIFDQNFLSELYSIYSYYPFESVLVQRQHDLDPRADDVTLRTFYKFKLGDAKYKLWQAMMYARMGVATPQISSRASAFLKVGGMPLIRQDEDFVFTQRLSRDVLYYYSSDLSVVAQDRDRPDGFDALLRHRWNQQNQGCDGDFLNQCDWAANFYDMTYSLRTQLAEQVATHRISAEEASDYFIEVVREHFNSNGKVETELSRLQMSAEPSSYRLYVAVNNSLLHRDAYGGQILFSWILGYLDKREWGDALNRYWKASDQHDLERDERERLIFLRLKNDPTFDSECKKLNQDPFIRALCTPDSALVKRLVDLRAGYYSNYDTFIRLAYDYPDWLYTFRYTPAKRDLFSYEEVARLLIRAHNHPTLYPRLHRVYEQIRF